MKRITFETAELAKKAGFIGSPTEMVYDDFDGTLKSQPYASSDWNNSIYRLSIAPFQAELQTWLRDVHNLHVNPDWFSSDPADWDFQVSEIGNEDWFGATIYIMDWQSDQRFTSFEDALEEGLKVALGFVIEKLAK